MQVGPQYPAAYMLGDVQHVVMIVPVNAEIDEAQHITEKNRQQRTQGGQINTVRHFHFQHHDGDDDGEHAIAERLHAVFAHDPPSQSCRNRGFRATFRKKLLEKLCRSGFIQSVPTYRAILTTVNPIAMRLPTSITAPVYTSFPG